MADQMVTELEKAIKCPLSLVVDLGICRVGLGDVLRVVTDPSLLQISICIDVHCVHSCCIEATRRPDVIDN